MIPNDHVRNVLHLIAQEASEKGLTFREAADHLGVQSIDQSIGTLDHFTPHSPSLTYTSGRLPIPHRPYNYEYDHIYGTDSPGMYRLVSAGLWPDNGYYGNDLEGR